MNDDQFLQQFEACSIPIDQWTHRAHVKVGYLYLLRYGFMQAGQKLRDGIKAYNQSKGIQDSPTGGYHETITQFWLRIIAATVQQYGVSKTADEFFDAHPQLSQTKIHRLFYSPGVFQSPLAKIQYVEPDLTRLPGRFDEPNPLPG